MLDPVRVLIAGENEEACWLLRLVLQEEASVAVVGYARSGRELVDLTTDLSPHVILLELDAPGHEMAKAIKTVKLRRNRICFVGLIGDTHSDVALRGELDACLDRGVPLDSLSKTLREVGSRKRLQPRPSYDDYASPRNGFDRLISLYIEDIERSRRELEEEVTLIRFWLEGNGKTELDEADRTSTTTEGEADREGSRIPSYILSVDSFFNAQHRVTVGGLEGNLHPHSWRVNVKFRQESLGQDHLLLGFADAKRILRGEISWFEGKVLNALPQFSETPPTTENIVALLYKNLKMAVKGTRVVVDSVTVWETPVNSVTYSEGAS